MTSSIVIFGGAGFLGSSIARAAISKGWRVMSVSRQGRPTAQQDWHDQVEWVRGDAFDPASFSDALSKADHVAHTIGVLDYRGVGKESKVSKMVDKVGSTLYDAALPTSKTLMLYDKMNRDALVSVSTEAAKHAHLKSFVYISAAAGFPGIPERYITTKREAESHLLQASHVRPIVFRPGFMFSDERGFTKPLARVLGLSYALNSSMSGKIPFLGAAGVKPLAVERVGSAVVEACDDDRIRGVIDIHQIEALADVRWRAEMIV